jgi:hypothetical protein
MSSVVDILILRLPACVKARGLFLFVLRKQIRVNLPVTPLPTSVTLWISNPKGILLENDEMGLGVTK